MNDIKKIDDVTIEITKEQAPIVERVTLDLLMSKRDTVHNQLDFVQAKLDELDSQIKQVKKLGVMTQTEKLNIVNKSLSEQIIK